jgi:hypothetical protein
MPIGRAIAFTSLILAVFDVHHKDHQCGGGGVGEGERCLDGEFSRPDLISPTFLSVWQPSLRGVGRFAH